MSPFAEELKKQDIIDQLTWDDSVNANEIHIDVQEGNVQLKGTVPNYIAKLAAERDAFHVPGVVHVENYINVEFPPRYTVPNDEEISQSIKTMLGFDSRIESTNVDVSSKEGVVTLQGKVISFWEKDLIEETANKAKGVIEVRNKLSVNLLQSIIDADIERDIKKAFQRSLIVDEEKVQVRVKNGVAHLYGQVINYMVKRDARNIAVYTKGVIDVVDEIAIQ